MRRFSTRPTPRSASGLITARVAELPVRSSRNVFALALSAPGVSELASGQTEFAGENRTGFSSNGMRLRSNNWMIDGQDDNDPNANNRHLTINNTDIVQEVRVITNQFSAEYRPGSRIRGQRDHEERHERFRGSAFIFHNDATLNSRSNLDKSAGLDDAPYRAENQLGGTLGGPVVDQPDILLRLVSAMERSAVGIRFHAEWRAHRFRPSDPAVGRRRPAPGAGAAETFARRGRQWRSATFTVDGRNYTVPLGSLTGSAPLGSDNHQLSARIDHQLRRSSRSSAAI